MALVRGMRDMLGSDAELYAHVVRTFDAVAAGGGFRAAATPLIEATSVFTRSLGGDSDVVSKEMFRVTATGNTDDGDDGMTLRPEGTAGLMRASAGR